MKDDSKKREKKSGTHSGKPSSATRPEVATTAGSTPHTADDPGSGDTMESPQPLDADATSPVSENEPPPEGISTTRVITSAEPEPAEAPEPPPGEVHSTTRVASGTLPQDPNQAAPTAAHKTTTRAPITRTKSASGTLPQKTDLGADSTEIQEAAAAPPGAGAPELIREQHTPPGLGGSDPGLVPGRTVGHGRFTLIRMLGRGGMGIVWLAKDTRLREEVALKLLPPEVAADPTSISDLGIETQKSRRLTHPHIIRIHDLYEAENEPVFISMEFVNGPNLTGLRLKQEQRFFSWEFIKPLMIQLCEALDYAHDEKVIHRDLKPANLMLDVKGRLKLADFGIAATLSDSMSRVSRKDTSGTLVYMSPQQMDGDTPRPTDDIYALGCTIYELLTSKPPFYTGNIEYQVHNVVPKLITERLAEYEVENPVPDSIVDLIAACLAKDAKERPQRAGIVLDWIKNGAPPDAEDIETESPTPAPQPADIPSAAGPGTSRPRTSTARRTSQPEPAPAPGTRRPTTRTQTGPGSGTTQTGTRRAAPPPPSPPDDDDAFQGETAEAPAKSPASRFMIPGIVAAVVVILGLVFLLAHSKSKKQEPAPVAQNQNPAPVTQSTAPTTQPTAPAKQTSTPPPQQKPVEKPLVVVETPPPAPTPAPTPAPETPKPSRGIFSFGTPSYPTADAPFENSLGLKFVAVKGTKVLFSTFDTRVQDYQKFIAATKRDWPSPSFAQDATHPAVNITWNDAEAFCKWLTEQERNDKKIGPNQKYRLPTDSEWSTAVGLGTETGSTPADRDSKMAGVYPWGSVPVPDVGLANLGRALHVDDFDRTSPVGSFPANKMGLYDMGGNVRQWCEDSYDSGGGAHVLRGSSWASVWNEALLSSVRTEGTDNPCEYNGFRCVFEPSAP